ncbi:MAG: hypothetical protein DHS80DRAFT_21459 [Piptocephalis tieghemiana]|nr:MAG: hypothetical protein DHS80DRAFT_21459 [Piptocephalis tieghemiana]
MASLGNSYLPLQALTRPPQGPTVDMDEEGIPIMQVGLRELPLIGFISFLLFLAGGLVFTYLRFRAQSAESSRRERFSRAREDQKPPRDGWATPPPTFEDAFLQTPPIIVVHGGESRSISTPASITTTTPGSLGQIPGTRRSSESSRTRAYPSELRESGVPIVRVPSAPPPVYHSKSPSLASSMSN